MIYTKNDSPREMSIKDFVFRSSRPILWTIKAKTFFYPDNRTPLFFPPPPHGLLTQTLLTDASRPTEIFWPHAAPQPCWARPSPLGGVGIKMYK